MCVRYHKMSLFLLFVIAFFETKKLSFMLYFDSLKDLFVFLFPCHQSHFTLAAISNKILDQYLVFFFGKLTKFSYNFLLTIFEQSFLRGMFSIEV